mmetsp:Transcript_8194/g.24583  ORF Transcript_8194/g.24583 Transcript_8194/m.24583 type:complete len:277 (-) Transcript_8194:20-850(-)
MGGLLLHLLDPAAGLCARALSGLEVLLVAPLRRLQHVLHVLVHQLQIKVLKGRVQHALGELAEIRVLTRRELLLAGLLGAWPELPSEEHVEIHHVRQLAVVGDEGECAARPSRPSGPSNPVHEKFGPRRKVVVHHIVDQWDVHAPRGDVGHHKKVRRPAPERADVDRPRSLVHVPVDAPGFQAAVLEDLGDELHVVLGGDEDDGALLGGDDLLDQEEQRAKLLARRHSEEPKLQVLGYPVLRVQPHELGVLETGTRELGHHGGHRRREEQALLALV